MPEGCDYLIGWFLELNEGRGFTGFGAAPITYVDLFAWSLFTGPVPSPGETRLLFAIDRSYLAEMQRLKPKTENRNPNPHPRKR